MENIREQLAASISLISRLPPSKIHKNQVGLIRLVPELEDNLLQAVDLPLSTSLDIVALAKDPVNEELFVKTEFNRDGDSYRSPYSNQYVPPAQADAYYPSEGMRTFEDNLNKLFKEYTKLYYEGGVGSFYISQNEQGFNCGYFAKKECDPASGLEGCWDSFNTMTVRFNEQQHVVYTLNTTVMVEMKIANQKLGQVSICGYRRNQHQQSLPLPTEEKHREAFHIGNIGRIIEQMETKMRSEIELINISRTQGVKMD